MPESQLSKNFNTYTYARYLLHRNRVFIPVNIGLHDLEKSKLKDNKLQTDFALCLL